MRKIKIAHLTSVHPRKDTRIFFKECCSLEKTGYLVTLIVADGKSDEIVNKIKIIDVGKPSGRFYRIFRTTNKIFKRALNVDADIYHIHDPELIFTGLKLQKKGKKVIFDSHEDVPKQLLSKYYLNYYVKKALSRLYFHYESWACKKLDAIVAATPYIGEKFKRLNNSTVVVNNYPILEELANSDIDWSQKEEVVCYIGGITPVRGIKEIVGALALASECGGLLLGGSFENPSLRQEVTSISGWDKVEELGWLQRHEVKSCLEKSIAGLVLLHPTLNYLDSLPVKMFEYMSVGIPVIASNFPLWKKIIEQDKCGVCVDPLDKTAIAEAIDVFSKDKKSAERMGRNGRKAVIEKYNWAIEEKKLFKLYKTLIMKKN